MFELLNMYCERNEREAQVTCHGTSLGNMGVAVGRLRVNDTWNEAIGR